MPIIPSHNPIREITSSLFGVDGSFQIGSNLYLTDLLDVLIIAVFIYTVFSLFKKTRSFLIVFGLSVMLVLYFVSQILNLYLTSIALKYFFSVFVFFLLIIFQPEIRKLFEIVGLISSKRIKFNPLSAVSTSSPEIILAIAKMSKEKVGALIVIQGHDDLEQVIEGGIALDGMISEELLHSIFDPHSEGHDGALIIKNNRVSHFGAHLPLSNNFKEIGKHGTRHSAGLGITEYTDSLSIIVSEEKGTISIAKDGKLKTLDGPQDLEKEYLKYMKEKFSPPKLNFIQSILSQNNTAKIVSLLAALIMWFLFAYPAGIVTQKYTVPINISNLSEDMLIESLSPKEISVTASGRGKASLAELPTSAFTLNINSKDLSSGLNKIPVTEKSINHPLNISITNIEPKLILLSIKKYRRAEIPILSQTKNTPPKGYQVSNVLVTPGQLSLWFPEDSIIPDKLFTQPIDLNGKVESFIQTVQVDVPKNARPVNPDLTEISVAVTIEKK